MTVRPLFETRMAHLGRASACRTAGRRAGQRCYANPALADTYERVVREARRPARRRERADRGGPRRLVPRLRRRGDRPLLPRQRGRSTPPAGAIAAC